MSDRSKEEEEYVRWLNSLLTRWGMKKYANARREIEFERRADAIRLRYVRSYTRAQKEVF